MFYLYKTRTRTEMQEIFERPKHVGCPACQSQWQRERRRQGVVERRIRSSERSVSMVMRQ